MTPRTARTWPTGPVLRPWSTEGVLYAHKQARSTQPYKRAGGRAPGLTLDMMLAGKSSMGNPMDAQRGAMRGTRRKRKRRDLASFLLEP